MSEVNAPELLCIYKEIKTHPEEWEQGEWAIAAKYRPDGFCNTAYCVAGHAVVRNGDTILWNDGIAEECRTPDGEVLTIEERAKDILGLNAVQACRLFNGGNDIYDLANTIKRYTGVDPETQ